MLELIMFMALIGLVYFFFLRMSVASSANYYATQKKCKSIKKSVVQKIKTLI